VCVCVCVCFFDLWFWVEEWLGGEMYDAYCCCEAGRVRDPTGGHMCLRDRIH
jgi:hypothetical protein